ncbi:MAG: limonene-1,2-epoxide hydrolase [Myxococcota bacterium]|jgi:limonene-1,2-epoxide hydrolase
MATGTDTATESGIAAVALVERFLDGLMQGDAAAVAGLLTDDVEWHNVGWPTIRGKRRVVAALTKLTELPGFSFTVEMHNIVANGDVVMTERTDGLWVGPLGGEFWVCGTFELRDGQIAVWRDRFDVYAMVKGTVRGTVRGLLGRR